MNYKNILKVSLAALASLAVLAGCAKKEFSEITELSLARCLEPQNLSARVDATTGDNITFGWDVNKDAGEYLLTVYKDENLTSEENSWTLAPGEVPFTTRLTADQKYWFTVGAYKVDAEGFKVNGTESHIAVYDGSVKTYAVKDNLYPEVKARTSTSVTFAWSTDIEDADEVTELQAVPVRGGTTVKYTITDAEKAAGVATISGLEPSTEYQITLFYMSASRGSKDVFTMADKGSATTITTSDELKTAVVTGGEYYLAYNEAGYSMGTAKPAASLSLIGELGPDGSKPVVSGKIELTADLTEENAILYFESIKFDGAAGSRIVEHTGGSPVVGSITFLNCEITNYLAGFFYGNNDAVVKIGTFKFDSCDMYGIPGSGGDAVDIRKTTEIDEIAFVNNTLYDGIRTLFRIDASDAIKIGHIDFENNTVKSIATIDDNNNRGIFAVRVPHEMTLKNNLFLWENGGKDESSTDADKAQLFQDNTNTVVPTFRAASKNYSYAHGKSFFAKVPAATAGVINMNVDPCYNSKGNFFQLAAQDLIEGEIGASKWWISYVERPEDLTQNVITEAHTWNLQNASLFAGDVKNSRVRDELMLVGTEATPINTDGGINFTKASVLTRKGVPTEGYISFKVNKPGSVDLLLVDPDKTGASVVVALYDDNGLAVQGGAVASSANPEVQKIVVPEVKGEGTIYLYSTGAVTLNLLAWSEDVLAGNRVLETPKPVVEPVTIQEGEAADVTVTWEAIDNAASYIVVFNKKAYEPQTETSFTVAGEDVAALKAGLYTFTVQAFPREGDIYYQKSELGNASIAIQPKGGEEQVEVTLTWDFSDSDWVAAFEKNFTKINNNENVSFQVNGLDVVGGGTLKYNKSGDVYFIQMGGKGSASQRAFQFDAPESGTLKVWASNTGDGEDLTRTVAVAVDGTQIDAQAGGYPKKDGPHELEFAVTSAGRVAVYGPVNGLIFYKVEFTYTTGGKAVIEYDWNFSDTDWVSAFETNFTKINNNENVSFQVNGLDVVGGGTLKYNKSGDVYFIQMGGKGSASQRAFQFDAPESGTLKVWASNTGDGEDLTRTVAVAVDGTQIDAQAGGYPKKDGPHELEFAVTSAGRVAIYGPDNGLIFYHVYFTNQ